MGEECLQSKAKVTCCLQGAWIKWNNQMASFAAICWYFYDLNMMNLILQIACLHHDSFQILHKRAFKLNSKLLVLNGPVKREVHPFVGSHIKLYF